MKEKLSIYNPNILSQRSTKKAIDSDKKEVKSIKDVETRIDLQDILDSFPFYVLLVDSEHNIVMANRAVYSKLGVEKRDIVGLYCPMVIHGTDKSFPGCPLEEAVEKNRSIERELFEEKTGRWIVSAIYPTGSFTKKGKPVFLHMVTDVTAQKQAQQQLVSSHAQLRRLASHMELIREEEKKKIARDLHDDTSQLLASLYAHLEAVIGTLPDEACKAKAMIKKAQALSTTVLDEIHQLIFELRPSILDKLGLMAAIRSLVDNQPKKDNLKINLKIRGQERRLPPKYEIEVYRVIQEALNNIFRHANAQNIDLIVYYWKNRFKIRIKDDGIGFDAREATGSKDISRGWGILGMKERVELLNGSIFINSTINHGTEIGIEIPLNTGVNCG